MENSANNTQPDYRQLQEMLPDYVFKRLSDEESAMFEANVISYPDLVEEIDEVRAVFHRAEVMNFEKAIDYRTRNLSIKVNDRLKKKQTQKSGFFNVRYLAPVLGALVLFFIFYPNTFKLIVQNSDIPTASVSQPDKGIRPTERDAVSNTVKEANKNSLADIDNKNINKPTKATLDDLDKLNNLDLSFVDDEITDEIISNSNEYKDFLIKTQKDSYQELLQMVDLMNENEIQTIIKELENADV